MAEYWKQLSVVLEASADLLPDYCHASKAGTGEFNLLNKSFLFETAICYWNLATQCNVITYLSTYISSSKKT